MTYEVGHGKPPVETQFKPGQSGNPGGKTAEQRQNEVKAAEIASRLRLKMLEALEAEDATILDRLDPNTLKLFKDSEDRAHGTPVQSVDHSTQGKPIAPVTGFDVRIVDAPSGDTDTPTG